MNELGERIAALIAAQGPLPVAQYMTLALHDPRGGYYATRDPIGGNGDFVTAPEISQMFGELIGLWCVQVWLDQDCPKGTRLVELGPGRGTLMADALRAARLVPEFAANVEIVLVEASPVLKETQQRTLAGYKLRWTTRFDEDLADHPLILVANEFFDALPIHQYVKTPRGWCERVVTKDGDGFGFALAPVPTMMASGREAPDGGVRETSPAAIALAEEIAAIIARKGGGALIVDYGYESGAGFGETLQAMRRHRFAEVLAEPGENDLTAHVDFGALAGAARRAGAAVFGPLPQGEFLDRLGIAARAERLVRSHPAGAEDVAGALGRLTDPGQMGTLFKVLAMLPAGAPPPPGFGPPEPGTGA